MNTAFVTESNEHSKNRKIRVPKSNKPRNPHVDELYDGTYRPRRESPKKQEYRRKEKYRNFDYDGDE